MDLKAVLFDLDGVITDTAKYHYLAWKTCANNLGFDIDESFNELLKGVDRAQSLRLLLQHGKCKLEEDMFKNTLEAKNNDYLSYIKQITEDDILPGIKTLLNQLQSENIACIVCSASHNAPLILKNLQLQDAFQGVVNPASVENGKPAPDIYIAGAHMAQADVSQCIGIEDAEAGIQAIKSAQMIAIGIGKELKETQADVVLGSTAELTISVLRDTLKKV